MTIQIRDKDQYVSVVLIIFLHKVVPLDPLSLWMEPQCHHSNESY